MRISVWSSDVCSSDLTGTGVGARQPEQQVEQLAHQPRGVAAAHALVAVHRLVADLLDQPRLLVDVRRQQLLEPGLGQQHVQAAVVRHPQVAVVPVQRSEEHTSELQSLMRISYAVFCLKKKKKKIMTKQHTT